MTNIGTNSWGIVVHNKDAEKQLTDMIIGAVIADIYDASGISVPIAFVENFAMGNEDYVAEMILEYVAKNPTKEDVKRYINNLL